MSEKIPPANQSGKPLTSQPSGSDSPAPGAGAPTPGDPVPDAETPANSPAEQALAQTTAERDEYLDQLQRAQADYQNFKRRNATERQAQVDKGVSVVVESLLPVLDACDAAALQGSSEVTPIAQALLQALSKAGLERIDAVGAVFDPNEHEAVSHEPNEGGEHSEAAEQIVTEEFRTGYRFNGQVLRASMVKVGQQKDLADGR